MDLIYVTLVYFLIFSFDGLTLTTVVCYYFPWHKPWTSFVGVAPLV
jgi:hypothetical protein